MILWYLASGAWAVAVLVWDRPAIPAWKTRNAYRLLCVGLLIALFKAALWNVELRALIPFCR